MICKACDKSFAPKHGLQKFCERSCYLKLWNRINGAKKMRIWRNNNYAHFREYESKRIKRIKNNPTIRLSRSLRSRIRSALKGKGKSAFTKTLIGCNTEELWIHLESKFQPGMTRDNYGYWGWHVDHIKPVVLYDMKNPEEQLKAFHYTNLQPLWAKDNLEKNSKY